MRIAQDQFDRPDFIDKLSGRHIKIFRKGTNCYSTYVADFKLTKRLQIITHNTHLVDYCETN